MAAALARRWSLHTATHAAASAREGRLQRRLRHPKLLAQACSRRGRRQGQWQGERGLGWGCGPWTHLLCAVENRLSRELATCKAHGGEGKECGLTGQEHECTGGMRGWEASATRVAPGGRGCSPARGARRWREEVHGGRSPHKRWSDRRTATGLDPRPLKAILPTGGLSPAVDMSGAAAFCVSKQLRYTPKLSQRSGHCRTVERVEQRARR